MVELFVWAGDVTVPKICLEVYTILDTTYKKNKKQTKKTCFTKQNSPGIL